MGVEVYADLHVHLGRAGSPPGAVKISAAADLTLAGILRECRDRKGVAMVGVIDAASAGALADLEQLLAQGEVAEQPGGGLAFGGDVTLIPGAEIEVLHERRPLHLLCYLPGLPELREFARWRGGRVRNLQLSTQRHHGTTASEAVAFTADLGGFAIPAHIFTPFKSALGAASLLGEIIDPGLWESVPAVELGLSSDTALADELPELSRFAYLSNSDAHSLGKIAREYNLLRLEALTFHELQLALSGQMGRGILANYGLDPRLGKYHRTYCLVCDRRLEGEPPLLKCPVDPGHRLVLGVLDRIRHYRDYQAGLSVVERQRPPYIHQVPLQFVPGLGSRTLDRLLAAFGSEMAVLHRAGREELREVVGAERAELVVAAREGRLRIEPGGGGVYGRVAVE